MTTNDFNPLDDLLELQEQFAAEFSGTELELYATQLGFHTLYDGDTDDPTIGWKTTFYGAVHEATEEVSIDTETLELNHGEVSPEAAREELKSQLTEHINWHDLEEQILDDVADHVANQLQTDP